MATARSERAERAAKARDEAAQERAGAVAHNIGVQSPGYILCPAGMHPSHNDAVTFVPGEMLPDWAAAALLAQRPEPDMFGVYRLSAPVRRAKK
jgi:hypothetical protein